MSQGTSPTEDPKRSPDRPPEQAENQAIELNGSIAEPEKTEQRLFSPDLLEAVQAHQAAVFTDSGESLLHQIVNLTAHGILDGDFNRLRDQHTEEITPLGDEVRSLISRGDILLKDLERCVPQGDTKATSDEVEQKLHPLLREFESAVDRVYGLNVRVIQDWLKVHNVYTTGHIIPAEEEGEKPTLCFDTENPVDSSNMYVDQHKDEYEWIKRALRDYQFDPELRAQPNDTNELLLELIFTGVEAEFSDSGSLIEMNPDHLRFLCSSVCRNLGIVGNEIHQKAIKDGFSENAFFTMSEEELSQTDAFAQVQHSFFGSKRIKAYITDSDELVLEYPAPKCLHEQWQEGLQDLHQRLVSVSEVTELYQGSSDVHLIQDEEVVRVALTLPMRSDPKSDSKERCQAELEQKGWQYRWDREPAMDQIEFLRDVTVESGNTKNYSVHTSGAALLSQEARTEMRGLLSRADEYVRMIPELDTFELSANGTAHTINEAFKVGSVSISLTGDLREEKPPHRAYSYVNDTFSWEEKAGIPKRSSWGETNLSFYRVSFTPTSFFDDSVRDHVAGLYQYSDLVQLPCEHDQESQYVSGEEQTNSLIQTMLGDLTRVLGEVQALEECGRLKTQVMQCIAMRFDEMGTTDGIFSLNIFDEKERPVAKGEFSREKQSWKVRSFNPEEVAKIVGSVTKVVEGISEESLRFRTLDDALREAEIELPDQLIMSLLDSARGISHHEIFVSPPVNDVIQCFLEDVHTVIEVDGDSVVIKQEQRITPETSSFGVIVDFGGQNPSEVPNYHVAKKLYEDDNYPFFQPNDIFLKRYDEEKAS